MAKFFDVKQSLHETARRPARGAAASGDAQAAGSALSVTQLTALIDKALKSQLPPVLTVQGEISNYKLHGPSGNVYFTLKDGKNTIDCVMWKSDSARMPFEPGDGVEVLATGSVKAYGARGKYQLYVTRLTPLGKGALELAFAQLRMKLEAEGLFDPTRKKPLPKYPLSIAMVTSRSAAGYQDMLKVLSGYPWLKLSLFHCPVQGDGAAAAIAEALYCIGGSMQRGDEKTQDQFDLILLGRGGGSLEDLWAFNEEVVARAVAACPIPIITGIGHEVDVSIADLVADYHAHTPTEAAQVAVEHWRTARDALAAQMGRLGRALRTTFQESAQRLRAVERDEFFRRPVEQINRLRQRLDDRQRGLVIAAYNAVRAPQRRLAQLAERLERHRPGAVLARGRESVHALGQRLERAAALAIRSRNAHLNSLAGELAERNPHHLVRRHEDRLATLQHRLNHDIVRQQRARISQLSAMERQLRALGPQQVLQRGYTITRLKKGGVIVRSSLSVKPGDRLTTRFADGEVESTAEDSSQLNLFD